MWREFRETDFYAYAGAEYFSDGTVPLLMVATIDNGIGEIMPTADVIAHGDGINVTVFNGKGDHLGDYLLYPEDPKAYAYALSTVAGNKLSHTLLTELGFTYG